MIVSWNWLARHVRLDMPVDVLTERLALAGLNHESTAEVGGDLAIDLEVTSNRPDCLSHIGVAREISVLFGRELLVPDPRPAETGPPVESVASVKVEAPDLCPQFTGRVVSGVTIGESPWWMRKRLETLGVRPISSVVDITNYVLFECGQPLHAYDLDHLVENRLVVRPARKGEKLTTINGKVYDLEPSQLVIADATRPVGLAGVMGGLDTEISATTRNVLIEAAQFDAVSVRRTSRALGLFSPSSYRFERPMDPERTEWASRRCAELILELAGGTLHAGVIDTGRARPNPPAIVLRLDRIPRVLGISIDREECDRILKALGLQSVDSTRSSLTYRPPSWRSDLEREIDLIEEVARIHGYEQIPEDRAVPLSRSSRGHRDRIESAIRQALTGIGFDEAYTFSLVSDDLIVPLGVEAIPPVLHVEHASRKKENALRISLTPSLLAVRSYNEAHGTPDARLFEIADVFLAGNQSGLPDQPTRLALVAGLDFAGMKGVVECLLDALHVTEPLHARPVESAIFASGRAAALALGETHLGYLGEIAPEQLASQNLKASCAAAELELQALMANSNLVPRARTLPSFPAVARDLSLVVSLSLEWADLARTARDAAGRDLESIEFLDTFQGGDLPVDRQSLHFGLRFRRADRTLTGDEVDRAIQRVIDACVSRFGAALRA